MKRGNQSECDGCRSPEKFLVHNVRHRGNYRRLCTSCVLKNFSESFCPICFHVFDGELPHPSDRVMCFKCPSISHSSCVIGSNSTPHFECPPCANPNFKFFDVNLSNKRIKGNGDNESEAAVHETDARGIDKDSAKVLLAAARIASNSMSKAAAVTRVEAERRVKEATLAKKRAKEALDRVAYLVAKEKNKDSSIGGGRQKVKHELDSLISAQRRIQNQVKSEIIPAAIQKRLGFRPKDVNGSISFVDNRQTLNVQGGEKDGNSNGFGPVSPQQQHQRSSQGNED